MILLCVTVVVEGVLEMPILEGWGVEVPGELVSLPVPANRGGAGGVVSLGDALRIWW